jgi:CheY-like chemotaxis protein
MKQGAIQMAEWRILVIEDDRDGQEVVSRMLNHHRIPNDAVYSAEEGLELLAKHTYTGVITDLALPGMDGWALLATMQITPYISELPCVAITAYHSAEVAVKAIEAGFAAYFPKPLEPASFVRDLQKAME